MDKSLLKLIHEIEYETGKLSQSERALLVTDGSITRLLETYVDAPVGVRTIKQNIVTAPADIAEILEINPGDMVNYREVYLYNTCTNQALIHAISYAPLSHLPPRAIDRLMKEDEPIGLIMRDESMESRREIISIKNAMIPSEHVWNRTIHSCVRRSYRIIHKTHPIFYIEETFPFPIISEENVIRVKTPSRIHIGLLDMNGTIGRIDGGAGITLEQPGFEFEITGSDTCMITSHDPVVRSRLQSILDGLKNNGLSFPPVHIHVKQSIPFHYGLGSGTQAALGIAAGIIAHTDQKIREDDLIRLSGRGGTSGIGVRSFFRGGLIVDAGHRFGHGKKKQNFAPSSISSGAGIAPLVGRYDIPKDWSFVLAIPEGFSNIHGSIEQSIFQSCCPVRLHDVQTLSHILVMKLIPSVIEEDLEQFGEAINEFQNYGFKQCEIALQPPVILEIMDAMKNAGAAGVGMSSFGPTIYAVCDSKISSISSAAQNCMNEWNGGEIICTKGSNCGAMILKNENEFIQVS